MAGALFFSKGVEHGISLSSSAIDFIAEYFRPYINQVNEGVMHQVFEGYDTYSQYLNFSELSPDDYMSCYNKIVEAIEVNLATNPIIHGRSQEWLIDIWLNEIKPKMKNSPLYTKGCA